jgi:hypothetical protein
MQTTQSVVEFLKTNGTQCRFISLVSETKPKLRPACPFFGVVKVSRKRGIVNANFNTTVRRRIAQKLGVKLAEVEYENGEVWYRHVTTAEGKPLPLVVNKNVQNPSADTEYYLQYFPTRSTNAYRMPNGDTVTEGELKPWFCRQSERPDYKPTVISIKVSNIKKLRASVVIKD